MLAEALGKMEAAFWASFSFSPRFFSSPLGLCAQAAGAAVPDVGVSPVCGAGRERCFDFFPFVLTVAFAVS